MALIGGILSLVALAGIGGAEAQAMPGPSFRCTGSLSPTEALICSDAELSAYDRAMALAWSGKWRRLDWSSALQLQWVRDRDRCGRDRQCVLESYVGWIAGLDGLDTSGPWLDRGAAPDEGGALMLGTLQSPTGEVQGLGDSGQLSIVSVGADWYVFRAFGNYLYDPHDGLGANFSTSEAVGMVHLSNGKGRFVDDPTSEHSCSIDFTRLRSGAWQLVENGGCSGLRSTLSGVYGK